jgi:Cu2+-exporting ATPase
VTNACASQPDSRRCLRIRSPAPSRRCRAHPVEAFRAWPGGGLEGRVAGRHYRIGHAAFALGEQHAEQDAEHWIVLASAGHALARFRLADTLRPEAHAVIGCLQRGGIHCLLLSGDSAPEVARVAARLGVEGWHARQSPEQKLETRARAGGIGAARRDGR